MSPLDVIAEMTVGKLAAVVRKVERDLGEGVVEKLLADQVKLEWVGETAVSAQLLISSALQQLVADCQRALCHRIRRQFVAVDPLPKAVTEENLARWAVYNLRPVFFSGEDISEDRNFRRRWIKPQKWFYDQLRAGTIPADSAKLKRGWYLADFSIGVDYTDGTQVFANDPLSTLIAKLREAGVVGKFDSTPLGSRFAITNIEWREKVLPTLTDELSDTGVTFRLERAIEFNAIGNIYDSNRGKFNMWEWFDDVFQGSRRLLGGYRDHGGLARVSYDSAGSPHDSIAGRPLGCFV